MKPEILAPAGTIEAVKAAVFAGADAIYLGGNQFGARAYANNFDENELVQVIEYAHLYGVKIYLTINTLFRNDEIQQLFDYLLPYYQAGLDAVIVQDFGVMDYVHQNFPDLQIHASTQMTITSPYSYSLLKDYGVTRIVPARELSLEEIKKLKTGNNIPELEIFVQGALCYCYSGQCLMSSILGGRSGNRGRCAQTCRLPYKVYTKEGNLIQTKGSYLLSPKDLCGLEAVPDLIKAGVDSFKIEGRMKKPEYVAACVRAYRGVVDAWFDGNYSENLLSQYKKEMAAVFNRGGFTKGYFYQNNGKNMMSTENPGNIGVLIGNIKDIRKNQIYIQLKEKLFKGDILVLHGKKNEITLTSNVDADAGKLIILNAPKAQELYKSQKVFRMLQKPLMEELEAYVREDKKIPVEGEIQLISGLPAGIHLSRKIGGKIISIDEYGEIVDFATSKPLSKDIIFEKISKIGNTKYIFDTCKVEVSENAFYSMKILKELRRNAFQSLEKKVIESQRRKACKRKDPNLNFKKDESTEKVNVMVSTNEQYQMVKNDSRIDAIYLDMQYFDLSMIKLHIQEQSVRKLIIVLPMILRNQSFKETKEILTFLQSLNSSLVGVLVRNIDELAYLKVIDYRGEIRIDSSVYTMNDYAATWIRKIFPYSKLTVSVELNQKQIDDLSFLNSNSEIVVYGQQQLMVSTQCLQSSMETCNNLNSQFVMVDRYNKKFFVSNICKYCYSLIYNGLPTIIFDLVRKDLNHKVSHRLHFINEDKKEVSNILDIYFNEKNVPEHKTRGHYNRGVE